MSRRATVILVCLGCLGLLAACADQGPVSGPGVLTGSLTSPNGPEGGAVVVLVGEGLGSVSAAGESAVRAFATSEGTRVVLLHPTGGELNFYFEVTDTTRPPQVLIEEVAGPDDVLRSELGGYFVEISR